MSDPLFVPAGLAKHWENEARHAWVENARLKAEVERLTKAEVERLRKEGEAMYPNLGPGWSHNAKEGKQP